MDGSGLEPATPPVVTDAGGTPGAGRPGTALPLAGPSTSLGLWQWQPGSGVLHVSVGCKARLGYGEGEIGSGVAEWQALLHPEDLPRVAQVVRDCLGDPQPATREVECRVRHRDGAYRWFLVCVERREGGSGHPALLLGCALDITGRQQADERLRASESLLRSAFEAAPLEFWVRDRDGTMVMQNAAVTAHWGDLRGKQPDESEVSPEALALWQANNRRAFAGEVVQGEIVLHEAGGTRWMHNVVAPFRVEGQVRGILGFNLDITERKRAEAALHESEARFRFLAESVAHLIWSTDADGRTEYCSQHLLDYLGLNHDGFVERSFSQSLHPDDVQPTADAWAAAHRDGVQLRLEFRLRRADGQYRWHLAHAMPFRDAAGRVIRWYGSCTDVDEQKRQGELLQHRAEELRRRSRQLAQLTAELTLAEQRERRRLADVLHDHLQQVLVAAHMHAQSLLIEPHSADQRQRLETLTGILVEALEGTRAVTRDLSPPVLFHRDPREALQWVVREAYRTHQLEVDLEAPETTDDLPEALAVLLFTAARELLLNTVKHAGTRRATVRLARLDDALRLEVCDDGVGFDPAVLQAPAADQGGFGLLSIRERTELLGGAMAVDSTPGGGTRVTLTIPVAPAPPPADTGTPGPAIGRPPAAAASGRRAP